MKDSLFIMFALFVCMVAGVLGGVAAYQDRVKQQEMIRQLEEWQRKDWVEDLIEMRRQEMINRREYKPS